MKAFILHKNKNKIFEKRSKYYSIIFCFMKYIDFNRNTLITWFSLAVVFFAVVFNVSGNTNFISLLGYGSSGDYTNPQTTFSGTTSVASGETLTGTTQVTFSAPVSITSWLVNVVIPSGTEITTSSGTLFDATQIATSTIQQLPLALPTTEESVGKIQFWITTAKLNFTKPVKLQIPVSTLLSTLKIKVKHFGDTTYTTNSLTNTISSNCSNGVAIPSSNIATVFNGIATIYTCSASDFIAIIDKKTVSHGSSGGWGWIYKDNCPTGDFSPSYYDRDCWVKPTIPQTDEVQNSVEENKEKKLTTGQMIRYKYVPILKSSQIKYKGYTITIIDGYTYSNSTKQLALKIIDNPKISNEKKTRYVGIMNNYLLSRYSYDLSIRQAQIQKNKFNKNTLLMKAVMRQVSK